MTKSILNGEMKQGRGGKEEDFVILLGRDCPDTENTFTLRNFDKPSYTSDSLGMVRLDPRYSAQAQIRNTLVNNYSAFMEHLQNENLDLQLGSRPDFQPALKRPVAASQRPPMQYLGNNNATSSSALKCWTLSWVGSPQD